MPTIKDHSLEFWNNNHRRKGDPTNETIWTSSPMTIATIHAVRDDGFEFDGSYGCQQAMIGNDGALFPDGGDRLITAWDDEIPLPWIPDWVGNQSDSRSGVIVIGPSYPPVIAGRSPHCAGLLLSDYQSASNADSFLTMFTECVLRDDDFGYFSNIESLLFPFRTAADLCYFNLCRGCFVTRSPDVHGDDFYGDDRMKGDHIQDPAVRKRYHTLYDDYVKANRNWAWERLVAGQSGAVIALGEVAEHGLLRSCIEYGASVKFHLDGSPWTPPTLQEVAFWPTVPADSERPIDSWIQESGRWWDVSTPEGQSWRVLPVHSLQDVDRDDPGYRRTRRVLGPFLNQ